MSFVAKCSRNVTPRIRLQHFRKNYSRSNEGWKAKSTLPLSLSWSSLKMRMESGADSKATTFSGAVRCTDDSMKMNNNPGLSKIMEDKQTILNPDGNNMSLDPNTSMWRQVTHTSQSDNITNSDTNDSKFGSIYAFFQKRLQDEEQKINDESNLKQDTGRMGSSGVPLYKRIARKTRNKMHRSNMVDAASFYNKGNTSENNNMQLQDDTDPRQLATKGKTKQRSFNEDDSNFSDDRHLYKNMIRRDNKPRMKAGSMGMIQQKRNTSFDRYSRMDRQTNKQRMPKRQQMERRAMIDEQQRFNRSNNRNEDAQSSQELRDDNMKNAGNLTEYSVYDDKPRTSPVFSSPHKCDDESSDKSNNWRFRDNDDNQVNDRKSSKMASSQFMDDEEGFNGSYTCVNPPEPLFKPSSGLASAKMKFFSGFSDLSPFNKYSTFYLSKNF